MKKIPALFLFAVLLANTAGFYVYYVIALQRIHSEMRARIRTLPDEQLSRLVLSHGSYKAALVGDDEIEVSGKRYDIARVTPQTDSVVIYALHDEMEEDFLAFANEIISKPFKQDSDVTVSVLHFISLLFLPTHAGNTLLNDSRSIVHHSRYLSLTDVVPVILESPPPRKLGLLVRPSVAL